MAYPLSVPFYCGPELVDVVAAFNSAASDRGVEQRFNIVVRSNPRPGSRGDDQYRERTNSRKHLLIVTWGLIIQGKHIIYKKKKKKKKEKKKRKREQLGNRF